MKNIKVRTKLTIIVALVLVLVASESFISIQNMNQLKNKALDTMDTSSRQNYDDSIKEQVSVVISLLSEINNEYKAGRYSLDEAKKIAADEIRQMRYGNGGYFWVDQSDGKNIVLLGNSTEGTNRMNTKDAEGYQMVKEIIRVAVQDGGGYTDYVFPKEGETEPSEETDTGLEFPYLLDDDKIQIDSLFQYSGINLDAQNEECEDVASLQLKNNSDQYLEKAEISVELTDGTAFSFEVEDIPDGKSVMAFDTANTAYDGKTGVALIDATTTYSSDAGLKETDVKITSDDNGVQLENISGNALANLKIKYHCVMDDMYFGGISSETEVAGLAAGETTTVDTSESILGDAEVVSITY